MLIKFNSNKPTIINSKGIKVTISFSENPNPNFDSMFEEVLNTLAYGYEQKLNVKTAISE